MRRIEELDVIGRLAQPVWQETMHRLMIIEAIMLGHIRGPNPARQLAEKPDVVKKLTIYRDKVRALMTLGLGFEPCHESDLLGKALEIQERHGLLTNDSLIAAIGCGLKRMCWFQRTRASRQSRSSEPTRLQM